MVFQGHIEDVLPTVGVPNLLQFGQNQPGLLFRTEQLVSDHKKGLHSHNVYMERRSNYFES